MRHGKPSTASFWQAFRPPCTLCVGTRCGNWACASKQRSLRFVDTPVEVAVSLQRKNKEGKLCRSQIRPWLTPRGPFSCCQTCACVCIPCTWGEGFLSNAGGGWQNMGCWGPFCRPAPAPRNPLGLLAMHVRRSQTRKNRHT